MLIIHYSWSTISVIPLFQSIKHHYSVEKKSTYSAHSYILLMVFPFIFRWQQTDLKRWTINGSRTKCKCLYKNSSIILSGWKSVIYLGNIGVPYYMKFWRHFNLANLAIFLKIAKLKCHQN